MFLRFISEEMIQSGVYPGWENVEKSGQLFGLFHDSYGVWGRVNRRKDIQKNRWGNDYSTKGSVAAVCTKLKLIFNSNKFSFWPKEESM